MPTSQEEGEKLTQLENFISRCEREGSPAPEIGEGWVQLEVQYYRLHDLPGRRYGFGPCAQRLSRWARAIAFGGKFLDFDMNNCHPRLLLKKALAALGKTQKWFTFPVFRKYVAHYKVWRRFLMEYTGIDAKSAKKALIKIIYGGKPMYDLPFLWALVGEVHAASKALLSTDEFAHLTGKFTDRSGGGAPTRLFYALAALEDDLMYQMCIDLKDCVPNSRIITYMFDGFVALPPPGYDAASIDIALANFQEIFGMVWEQGNI